MLSKAARRVRTGRADRPRPSGGVRKHTPTSRPVATWAASVNSRVACRTQ